MKKSLALTAGAIVLGTLTGCVVVSEKSGSGSGTDPVRASQFARLEMGLAYDAVLERLGPPVSSAAQMVRGVECRYLVYVTRTRTGDGSVRRDPVRMVFEDGSLTGWGDPGPACPAAR